jgi:hypothetical protein
MNSLVKALIQPILEIEGKSIALIPGGFKPPTLGHFYLVDEIAKRPEVSKAIVLIGHKDRDGITKEESEQIWNIYKKYLPSNVEIQISQKPSPISDINSIIKNDPTNFYFPVVGVRGEEDMGDLKRFDSLKGKYDNFKPIIIKSESEGDRISGTNARLAILNGEFELFQRYLPTELSKEDRKQIWDILVNTPINEIMYAEPSKFSYPTMLSSLIQYMISKGMNIRPLPKVKFIEDDVENARDFFGKTAYYNPNSSLIVLYTYDRHPKDVMRSFAHEMIHHEQNCNGKLGNITTQNTNEGGDLPEIEREAYEKGNMMFRNWTDTLTESVMGDRIECDNCDWSWPIKDGGNDLYVCHKCGHDNTPNQLNEGRYDKITNIISSKIFNQWKEDYNNGAKASRVNEFFPFEGEELDVDANISFIPGLGGLKVDGGADDETDYIEVRFEIDPEKLPEFWEEISFNLKDVIRHEMEHLTHGDGEISIPNKRMEDDLLIRKLIDVELLPKSQYFKLEKEIDANLQGMYLRAKKEKRPFKDVIDTYLNAQDITPEEKEEILDLWRSRLSALNLPLFESKNMIKKQEYIQKYTKYVLTELFEKDLPNITKISNTEYIVGNGTDIEAKYFFKLASLNPNDWEIHWNFTDNNNNTSLESWKQVTATSYKILTDFIQHNNPTYIEISGNTDSKTKIYKSKSYLEKLETILNNQYVIDNSNDYVIYLKRIEEIAKSNIKKRMETLNESYEQSLDYFQNGDINSKSKIERWKSIKKIIERDILKQLYKL